MPPVPIPPPKTAPVPPTCISATLCARAGGGLSEGEPAYEEMALLDTALQASVARQALLADDAEGRFAAGLERTALGKRAQEKEK
eukprot:345027-Chlamydomonas_euryale.AAC.6